MRRHIRLTPTKLFVFGSISCFVAGVLSHIIYSIPTLGIPSENTTFHSTPFPVIPIAIAIIFAFLAGIYHLFPKLFNGRRMNTHLGYIHFALTFVGIQSAFWAMLVLGTTGVPYRYYSFKDSPTFDPYSELKLFIWIIAIIIFLAQLLFAFNFLFSIKKGKKLD